ncbi:MAG: hypothetical protein ACKESB_01010 [Candidatus Hodgkinia cicadicola]
MWVSVNIGVRKLCLRLVCCGLRDALTCIWRWTVLSLKLGRRRCVAQ